jgi:hypothetical protein
MHLTFHAIGPMRQSSSGPGRYGTSYWKGVDRPYPGVPRKGDQVCLDDKNGTSCEVTEVSWRSDGTVVLDFGTDWDVDELKSLGFGDLLAGPPGTATQESGY